MGCVRVILLISASAADPFQIRGTSDALAALVQLLGVRCQVRTLLVLPLLVALQLLPACACRFSPSGQLAFCAQKPFMSSLVPSAAWDCRTVCCTSAASPSRPSTLSVWAADVPHFMWLLHGPNLFLELCIFLLFDVILGFNLGLVLRGLLTKFLWFIRSSGLSLSFVPCTLHSASRVTHRSQLGMLFALVNVFWINDESLSVVHLPSTHPSNPDHTHNQPRLLLMSHPHSTFCWVLRLRPRKILFDLGSRRRLLLSLVLNSLIVAVHGRIIFRNTARLILATSSFSTASTHVSWVVLFLRRGCEVSSRYLLSRGISRWNSPHPQPVLASSHRNWCVSTVFTIICPSALSLDSHLHVLHDHLLGSLFRDSRDFCCAACCAFCWCEPICHNFPQHGNSSRVFRTWQLATLRIRIMWIIESSETFFTNKNHIFLHLSSFSSSLFSLLLPSCLVTSSLSCTCERGDGTQEDVLNVHTESFLKCTRDILNGPTKICPYERFTTRNQWISPLFSLRPGRESNTLPIPPIIRCAR